MKGFLPFIYAVLAIIAVAFVDFNFLDGSVVGQYLEHDQVEPTELDEHASMHEVRK